MYNSIQDVPVLLIAFNRPTFLAEVVKTLREVKPKKVYVSVDGPRISVVGESDLVKQNQNAINLIDWPCEIFTKFEPINLGCKKSVIKAIDWIFENEEMAIILEDDILPKSTFFHFCFELLQRYKDDSNVLAISGFNSLNDGIKRESYRFSSITHVWGWATWKRSWQNYPRNFSLESDQPSINELRNYFSCSWLESFLLKRIFKKVADGSLDTWDYQLVHLAMQSNAYCATSNINLIDNIGFGPNSTHTKNKPNYLLSSEEISFPLIHPPLERDQTADQWIIKNAYGVDFPFVLAYLKKQLVKRISNFSAN